MNGIATHCSAGQGSEKQSGMGLEVHSGGLLPLECIDWDIAAVIWTEERMAEWHRIAKQSGQLPTGSCPVGFFTKCSEFHRMGLKGRLEQGRAPICNVSQLKATRPSL